MAFNCATVERGALIDKKERKKEKKVFMGKYQGLPD